MIKYFYLPLLLFVVIAIFQKIFNKSNSVNHSLSSAEALQLQNKLFYILCALYIVIFGVLSILRYVSLHSTFCDMGIFENTIWKIAYNKDFYLISFGHFWPILLVYALIYKIFSSGITLLLLQTIAITVGAYPLYKIAQKHLKGVFPIVIVLSYFLYFGVEYNNLFDFHPDHLFMTLLLFGFYFLEEKNIKGFMVISVLALFIKEPLLLSLSLFGLYAGIKHKNYKEGFFIFVIAILFFIVVTQITIPFYFKGKYPFASSAISSKFNLGFLEIIKSVILHPSSLIVELFSCKEKLIYLFCIFAPLLFVPLLSPLALLPTLPMIFIAILSQAYNYYSLQSHYSASIIPGLFVAFIYGLKKIEKVKWLAVYVVSFSIYFNVVLSSSPSSLLFWEGKDWIYSKNAYLTTNRDKMINVAIKKYIPVDSKISVTTQNSINSGKLAKRDKYLLFPQSQDFNKSDYVILDLKRALFAVDRTDGEKIVNDILKTRKILFEEDGFYILTKKCGLVEKDD
ncbi:MAG: DUF2079 domain-containing protein [Candidatus Firestonebacteria bacterium]